MENKEVIDLLRRYDAGKCSVEEQAVVETWYLRQKSRPEINLSASELEKDLNDIFLSLPRNQKPGQFFRWYKIAAAAVILITLATVLYFYAGTGRHASQYARLNSKAIKAGGNYAILTLADGSKISLDHTANGEITRQSGISIEKTKDGQLIYKMNGNRSNPNDTVSYNTIETPKGGEYQVNLSDGTKIWLNSASSLKFPTAFAKKQRLVVLNGEAYFEVAHNKAKPFEVLSGKQTVEVLGTHFNINSYLDEPAVKTTLLQGSVKISDKTDHNDDLVLKPGEQSILSENNIKITKASADEVLAWKNGYFIFKNEDIKSIMRKLARWYNLEVIYEGDFKDKNFEGSISRFKDIAEVLRKFELTESIYFKIEGRRITVME